MHGLPNLPFLMNYFSNLAIDCPPGEVPDQCPALCSYDFCPTSEFSDQIPCEKPDRPSGCSKPACKCPFNKRRDQFGSCVDIDHCRKYISVINSNNTNSKNELMKYLI